MQQEVLWVPGSPSWTPLEGERPFRLWTLYQCTDPQVHPVLPFVPQHNVNAFLEDHMHDWILHRGKLKYFSRVVGPGEGVWLLLEY